MIPPAQDTIDGARFAASAGADGWRLVLEGSWTTASIAAVDPRLRALKLPDRGPASIDLRAVERLDTAGAWLVHRTELLLAERGIVAEISAATPAQMRLVDAVRSSEEALPEPLSAHARISCSNVVPATIRGPAPGKYSGAREFQIESRPCSSNSTKLAGIDSMASNRRDCAWRARSSARTIAVISVPVPR